MKDHAVALNLPDFGSRISWEPLNEKNLIVESWESVQANQNVPLFVRGIRVLANSMHKSVHRGAHGRLRVIGLEREVEEFYLLLSPRCEA